MEFTKNLLENLKDSGKNICVYSKELSIYLNDYNCKTFSNYSTRSYYFWLHEKRPLPLDVVLKILDDKMLDNINVKYFSVGGGNKVNFPNENDLRFCYFIGLILGDGCLVHRKRDANRNTYAIQIVFRKRKDAEKIKISVKDLFDVKSSIYPGVGDCFVLAVYSKPLVLILNKKYQIPIGLKYNSLCVPNLFINGNASMKKAFLKGVFDSDGNLYAYRKSKAVQLRQKSKYFLDGIRDLLSEVELVFNNPYFDKANNS